MAGSNNPALTLKGENSWQLLEQHRLRVIRKAFATQHRQ
jgi:hypothetical protein